MNKTLAGADALHAFQRATSISVRKAAFIAAIFTPVLITASARAQEAPLWVEKAVWTDTVNRNTRNYTNVHKSPVGLRSISLWMELRGSAEFLKQLQADRDGKVRIRHVWKKYDSEDIRTDHDQILTVGRQEDLAKLAHQVAEEGSFSWRVWSDKIQLSRGNWRVDVLWENDDPILCRRGGQQQACTYPLQVR